MKFALRTLLIFFGLFFFLRSANVSFAQQPPANGSNQACQISVGGTQISLSPISGSTSPISPVSIDDVTGEEQYAIRVCNDGGQNTGVGTVTAAVHLEGSLWNDPSPATLTPTTDGTGCSTGLLSFDVTTPGTFWIDIRNGSTPICQRGYSRLQGGTPEANAEWEASLAALCQSFTVAPATEITSTSNISIGATVPAGFVDGSQQVVDTQGRRYSLRFRLLRGSTELNSQFFGSNGFVYASAPLPSNTYQAGIELVPGIGSPVLACQKTIVVGTPQNPGEVTDPDPEDSGNNTQAAFMLCRQATTPDEVDECERCVGGSTITDPSSQAYWTAFGCVNATSEGIVQSFLRIGMGLAGGFVLLSILYGAFLLTTSSGDPKRVQEGQEMITSAIMGLLFVIFSIVILRFIGITILRIPGF